MCSQSEFLCSRGVCHKLCSTKRCLWARWPAASWRGCGGDYVKSLAVARHFNLSVQSEAECRGSLRDGQWCGPMFWCPWSGSTPQPRGWSWTRTLCFTSALGSSFKNTLEQRSSRYCVDLCVFKRSLIHDHWNAFLVLLPGRWTKPSCPASLLRWWQDSTSEDWFCPIILHIP